MRLHSLLLACLISSLLLLGGCATNSASNFKLSNLAKSDIDSVTDMHIKEVHKLCRELTIKLYKRNPRELAKAPPGTTVKKRIAQIFSNQRIKGFTELNGAKSTKAITLSFSEEYPGDRVFALMAGLSSMLFAAYNYQDEFFLLDEIDQQKLYNSARNLETVAWQLNNRRNSTGERYILSNGVSENGIRNLSYERLFGKLISLQDMMALLIADTTNRNITRVVQSAASMTFLPI
ncbi:hypothetical protein SAMN03080615_03686 [Amphritea atlantica]|uniref:Lipoprotein n=1 Tax=Amphritea atlantica TaxID=355243 RepID=A0A1H9KYS8_9GAMM|nr:hypothetical protein [Amphritea atlantica]SER04037.1 hypothetical protein SAMN03080615_03686 [Amphritea atlantica]